MTSCMHAHTSSYIYVTCQMTEKTFSHLLFTSNSLKLILVWRACSALNHHVWFIRFQLPESVAYDTLHAAHMDAHGCHKWSKPSWNFYLNAYFYIFQFSEIHHHVLMVLMLCFSTTVVCRSGFRHIGQMGCIQKASLSGVLRFPQGELCQRPEPFGTRPEQGHHYWQLAGVVHLSSRKCSEWHLFCCIWYLHSYLYLITLLFVVIQ